MDILLPISANQFTIKASFSFAHLAKSYNHNNEVMCSFDFKLLVYNRSTRRDNYNFVLINKLYALPDPPKLSRSVLKFCLSWLQRRLSHFIFYGQYYDQIDGVAVGSPLGPVMANILMCHFEEKWVLNSNVRPSVWFRYVDDTLTLFDSKDIAVLRSPFCLVMKGHSSTAVSLLSNEVNVSSTYRNQTEGRALLLRKKKKNSTLSQYLSCKYQIHH